MCGRITLKTPERIRFERFNVFDPENIIPRYNIAPSQDVLAVVQRGELREATFLQWGLVPFWSQEPKGFINARAETIERKRAFSEAFQKRRCLILADGFYEWQKNGKVAQPYYFQMKDESPFAFAGIWDRWKTEGGSITSCAIITTKANELTAPVHNRMPVIIGPESYDEWLSDDPRTEHLKDLLTPFPAAQMISHPVGRDVNDTKIDDEHLVQPVDAAVGVNYRLF